MILLDTNVVSEAMKPEPHPAVLRWLDAQAAETLFISSVTVAELLFGVGVLPAGARKDRLHAVVDGVLTLFADRVLPFDIRAAQRYADQAVTARVAGRGFPTPDGYIAAIAAVHGFAVASRDVSAFMAGGLKVIDPWRFGEDIPAT
ncbi:MAG: type II toxin-antitoxin system VapC family toxin [Phenylobacterium sp.]|uniref:type II toxin-antitoxin system VapC family toxin n=1 Tax=Phenylobacterium sp. TaxID=1871053 RepID=UPI0027162F08|nr:type II toxin-antitoxin system VapC family toxin [Phenylobacterium sp.]MDO8411156.1 type II toxin-antitoxin system VapC family toxin [Phenylobacterium sp.]